MAEFEPAFKKTLEFEGGYSLKLYNVITTYAGISRLISPYWFGWEYTDRGEQPPEDAVQEFFYLDLWCPLWCYQIDDPYIAWALFDFAVTTSSEIAVTALQEILGVKPTGTMGCDTLEMLNCSDEMDIRLEFAIKRIREYLKLTDNYELMTRNINRALTDL